jgi:hypothetical protein
MRSENKNKSIHAGQAGRRRAVRSTVSGGDMSPEPDPAGKRRPKPNASTRPSVHPSDPSIPCRVTGSRIQQGSSSSSAGGRVGEEVVSSSPWPRPASIYSAWLVALADSPRRPSLQILPPLSLLFSTPPGPARSIDSAIPAPSSSCKLLVSC